jgi:hypothetical protein
VRHHRLSPAVSASIAVFVVVLVAASLLVGAASAFAANVAPVFTSDSPPAFTFDQVYGLENSCGSMCSYNEQYGYAFSAAGSPAPTYSVSSGALPAGVYLDPANGLLYGFPSSSGQAYSFSVSASNGVSPDAVAGPFSGTVSAAKYENGYGSCLPGEYASPPGGSNVTTSSTSTKQVAASAVEVTLPDATASVTRVLGRVIENGTPTVVYEQQAPVAASDPQAQALLSAAANADSGSAPGAVMAAPTLASTVTSTSAAAQVGQITPGPASTRVSAVATSTIGQETTGSVISIGELQSCLFKVKPGAENLDTLISYPVAAATDELQATETTTSTYYVDATVPPPAVSTSPLAGLAPAPVAASTPIATAASVLALGCSGAKIELTNVHEQGSHVVLEGAAVANLIGSKVKLLFSSGKQVASTTVAANGFFTATAPLPPAKIRDTNTATYSATIGTLRSADLKLTRRLIITSIQGAGTSVHFTGTVTPPLATPAAPVLVKVSTSCTATPNLVASVKPSKTGAFAATASIPAGATAAIFTLESKVRQNTRTKKAFPTVSLPQTLQG